MFPGHPAPVSSLSASSIVQDLSNPCSLTTLPAMPNKARRTYHFERALFVVGEPNSGKSTQIRSMFCDFRFGKDGKIPNERKLPDMLRLSNERRLYLRITSPHENGESLEGFLDKTESKINRHISHGMRWNLACPLQPNEAKLMPNAAQTVGAFIGRFSPERTRVVFLNPDRHGAYLERNAHTDLVHGLRKLYSKTAVEICWIDARNRTANGLLLADFFDFT